MNKKIITTAIILAVLISSTAVVSAAKLGGRITPASLWRKSGSAILPTVSTWELGKSTSRLAKGWFTDVDSTSMTIGGASEGPLTIDVTNAEALLVRKDGDTGDVFTVDTSGSKVGIGGKPTDGALHILTASAGAVTANVNDDDLVIENSTHAGLSILTPNNVFGTIAFGDPEDNDIGRIDYDHTNDKMRLIVNALAPLIIDNSGNVGIGVSPLKELHIYDATAAKALIESDLDTTGSTAELLFKVNSLDTDFRIKAGIIFDRQASFGRGDLHFAVDTVADEGNIAVSDAKLTINSSGNATFTGNVTSSDTADLGWTVQSAANQACTTTCTSAAVFGFDTGASNIVGPSDATADACVCAGSS
ncbi:hypothetical protein MYX07_00375 [Patescibacteria group bacterium AH-259-L07]|nr:hypothetical protein [Patescibacteria group bacterium AH-259-L07]